MNNGKIEIYNFDTNKKYIANLSTDCKDKIDKFAYENTPITEYGYCKVGCIIATRIKKLNFT